MKLVSWNVNGLRSCMSKGFKDVVEKLNADIRIIKNKFGGTSVVDWNRYCRYKSFEEER